jgi:hypothetical protein
MSCTEEFFTAYLVTALWSSNDESDEQGGQPLDLNFDIDEISEESLARMRADCDTFYDENETDLNCDGVTYGPDFGQDGRAGHDFWLTRNHHGAGFWDGDWPEAEGERLTKAAHKFGECNLYVGDDKQIYCD